MGGIDKHPDCAQPSRVSWRRCDPKGVVVHDFVCSDDVTHDDAGIVRMTLNGVTQAGGKFLPGPLYHFIIDGNGDGWRTAENAAKCNHVGKCDAAALARLLAGAPPSAPASRGGPNGNRHTLGVCLLRSGRHLPSRAMMVTLTRLLAALCRDHDWSTRRVVGHHELTTRKVDPGRIDMPYLRDQVDAVLDGRGVSYGESAAAGDGVRPTLRPGYEGRHIAVVHGRLRDVGLLAGGSDGVFDDRTERAVRTYQRCHWLVDDGVIGPLTWRALLDPPRT